MGRGTRWSKTRWKEIRAWNVTEGIHVRILFFFLFRISLFLFLFFFFFPPSSTCLAGFYATEFYTVGNRSASTPQPMLHIFIPTGEIQGTRNLRSRNNNLSTLLSCSKISRLLLDFRCDISSFLFFFIV